MTPATLLDLIQEMRRKKAMFGDFARFVNFNLEFTRTAFKRELIRSYAAFLDALDAAIDDYNESENATPKLLYQGLEDELPTAIANGRLDSKDRGYFDPAVLPAQDGEESFVEKTYGKIDPPEGRYGNTK